MDWSLMANFRREAANKKNAMAMSCMASYMTAQLFYQDDVEFMLRVVSSLQDAARLFDDDRFVDGLKVIESSLKLVRDVAHCTGMVSWPDGSETRAGKADWALTKKLKNTALGAKACLDAWTRCAAWATR